MIIYLNEQPISVDDPCVLSDFLENRGYLKNYYAVAVNAEFIPHGEYSSMVLKDCDRLDLVMPMQGG